MSVGTATQRTEEVHLHEAVAGPPRDVVHVEEETRDPKGELRQTVVRLGAQEEAQRLRPKVADPGAEGAFLRQTSSMGAP